MSLCFIRSGIGKCSEGASARPAVPALRGTPQVAAESSARPLGATPLAMLGLGVCGAMVRKQRKGGRTWEEVDRMAKEDARSRILACSSTAEMEV